MRRDDSEDLNPLPPPPPPKSSGSLTGTSKINSNSNIMNKFQPHESSLGVLPGLESAPPSGNIENNIRLDPLPPPPPPPKHRSNATFTSTAAPSSSNSHSATTSPPLSTGGSSTSSLSLSNFNQLVPPPLPPPPKVAGAVSKTSPRKANHPPPPPPPLPTQKVLTAGLATGHSPPTALTDPISPSKSQEQAHSTLQQQQQQPPQRTPPPKLPLTTFLSTQPSLLARRQTHIPLLIIATESAQQLAWKNGLANLAELFQGIIEDLTWKNIPTFRSMTKHLTLLQVSIQCLTPEQLESPANYEESHSLLQSSAKVMETDGNMTQELQLLEDRLELLIPQVSDTEAAKELPEIAEEAYQLTSPLDIPWFTRYRYALDETTNALPHEMIQCPPLVLCVCSSGDEQEALESPVEILRELVSSPHNLPEAFRNGWYDPNSLRKEVLVLHDAVEGPSTFADLPLRTQLQRQFGPHAAVLRINSSLVSTEGSSSDLWGGAGKLGSYLTPQDVQLLKRYLASVVTQCVLPSLEQRIAKLNAIVSERKKGVRNLVKSFWRKPKEESNEMSNSWSNGNNNNSQTSGMMNNQGKLQVLYRYDAIESQTRLLADTLFLMRDYEAALSTYRLIRDDFKSDKALVHYASIQEMMGLCMLHLGEHQSSYGRSREVYSHLETALLSYTRAAEEERQLMSATKDPSARPSRSPHATRLATRLCLLLATAGDSIAQPGREVDVADLLASASSHESSLGAGVLLEQASAFYFEARMYRKYAFHMLMSGHMFRTASQDHHAFRCFTAALYIYRQDRWSELHGHLKSALAAQLYGMGRYAMALILYAKLAEGAGKVSVKSQQKFLAHLLEICQEHPSEALMGADRMAVPPTILDTLKRGAYRLDFLDQFHGNLNANPGATRILELTRLQLPKVIDSSVRIWTHAETHFLPSATASITTTNSSLSRSNSNEELVSPDVEMTVGGPTLGDPGKGDSEVWEDLELLATAEWNALDSTASGLDETTTTALSKIEDPQHRKVIAQIDKEKQSRALLERSRRKGSIKPKPAVRALQEPIFCDFVLENPLNAEVRMTKIQLVARMVDANDRLCTNEKAIQLSNADSNSTSDQTWTFPSTEHQTFSAAEFSCVSNKNSKQCSPGEKDPFFVVTKHDLDLAGDERLVVSAGLTPLVEGDLEILGVRFKLSDQVWVYHEFDIPGPLLNDTRSNRANRVRGESLLLKSKVSVGMPCIAAELVKQPAASSSSSLITADGGPLLEGQISTWVIRLRNVGSAMACQLLLKTNLPWVNVPSSAADNALSEEELESRATSNCVGPSGTLMLLPLEGKHLKKSGVLCPGESAEVSIQIRTSGLGKRQFYMLYQYSLFDDASAMPSRRRWLRKMYEVPVFPSLELSTQVQPSSWKDNEQILSVEFKNHRTDRPTDLYLTLDTLGLASRRYKLEALAGQFRSSDQVGDAIQIGWQERLTLHYRIVPAETDGNTCLLSQCPFRADTTSATCQLCVRTDAMDFLCLERACEKFEAAWTSHQKELFRAEHDPDVGTQPRSIASIRRANTVDSSSMADASEPVFEVHATSIGKLCPEKTSDSKVHVICNWRAILGDEVIFGEHHMRGVSVRSNVADQACPITATALYASSLSHDFSVGPAIVPVEVTLRNRTLKSSFNLSVTATRNPNYELLGLEAAPLSLKPKESAVVPFEVLLPRAGTYDLQSLQLVVDGQDGESNTVYQLEQQWLVGLLAI